MMRDRRKKLSMSQARVAELSGKTQSQIARFERGIGDPRISGVVQVSRSLGTELIAVPIGLLPVIKRLIAEHEYGTPLHSAPKLVGNDPENIEKDD